MKATIFATTFAIAVATVSAQSLADIPSCATTCAFASIGNTACSTTDFKCVCNDSNFIKDIMPCVSGDCGKSDQEKLLKFANGLCQPFGVVFPSNILSANNGTANGTITTSPSGPTSTDTTAATSTNGAAKMAGSGFVAAVMGAAMFVL